MQRGTSSKGKAREDGTNSSGTTAGYSSLEREMSDPRQSKDESLSPPAEDDWSRETDPYIRRRIQNKLAQRKFRERTKIEKQEKERNAKDTEQAEAIYSRFNPNDLEDGGDLPWGGISIKHVMKTGMAKDRFSSQSSAAGSSPNLPSGTGSSSR
ncbi:hypothetical protein GP486_008071 [Trichoglossum hirsutum]|uniref:BZIP domain-containing protein n=1 Tax=Trichoglossum hirsutum TaxID=265104 RepID=A0A9P8IJ03_9PEZI|nr:hypothetical protein GP486_008071 [Trichoglossum hirsutum]